MADSEQTDDERTVVEALSQQLKALGFDPGTPVFEMSGTITMEQVQQALFASTYNKPVVVPFTYGDEPSETWSLPMVVELVQAIYEPFSISVGENPLGCWEHPCLYLRGYLQKSAFDPYPETIRMHAYLDVERDEGTIEGGTLQLVRPSGADPQTPLVRIERAPGQDS